MSNLMAKGINCCLVKYTYNIYMCSLHTFLFIQQLRSFDLGASAVVYPWHATDFALYLFFTEIKDHIKNIDRAVSTKEPRFMSRVLRALVGLRRKLNSNVLRRALGYFPIIPPQKEMLMSYLDEVGT